MGPSHVARLSFLTDIETVGYGLSSKVDIFSRGTTLSAMGQKPTLARSAGMSALCQNPT